MPIYEYKGQQYDISTDDPVLAKQKILKHLGTSSSEPVKTKWYEDIGAGLRDIPEQITQAGLMGLGGVAGLVGAEAASDAMFDKYVERSKEFRDREAGLDRGEVGKVLRGIGQVPAYLMPSTAAMMIGSGAIKTGGDLAEEGASTGHALAGAGADLASSAAMLALGPLANLSGRTANAALQGGLNVAQEAGINRPVQNVIRESAGVQELPATTPGDYGAAFIPGAAMGAAFTKPRAQAAIPEVDPALTETRMPSVSDLDSNYVTQSRAVIKSINGQIENLQLRQAELASNGPMTEKQFNFYQSLQKQIDLKQKELSDEMASLSKYEPSKADQSTEELKAAIAELDISQPTTNKQKGSWTPFAGEEPRPDDSDAPGVLQPQPKRGFSFKKQPLEKQDPDFSDSRVKQPPPEGGKTLAEWEAEENASYARDIERQGSGDDLPVRADGATLTPSQMLSKLEVSLAKVNTLIAKEEAGIGNLAAKRDQTRSFSEEKGRISTEDPIQSLLRSKKSLESRIDKLYRINPNLKRGGTSELGKQKLASKFASKDNTDQSIKTDPVFPEDAERLRQQLLNEGKSERAADVEVEKQYPSHPVFRQGKINKESGMWTPWATSNDTNAKRAKNISAALDLEQNIDVTKRFSAADILTRMQSENIPDSSGSAISAIERAFAGRGQFVEANKRAQPIVWEQAKILRKAKDNEIANKRGWWSGTARHLAAKAFGPFMKLSHYKDPQTPEHVKAAATDADSVAIAEYMQLAAREHVNHIQKDSPNLTEQQRAVLNEFNKLSDFQQKGVKIFTEMMEKIRQTRHTPYLAGYIPHSRKGDFGVYLKTSKGDPIWLEFFPTKKIADEWINQAKKAGHTTSDIVDMKTPEGQSLAESFGLVRDILDSLNDNNPKQRVWINKIMDETLAKVSENPDIGQHRKHYEGLGGFIGNRLFKTRLENAKDFMKSMEEYASSSAAQNKKVEIIRENNKFWDTPEGRKLRELYPNQAETADYMTDVAMNKNQKYGWTESIDTFRGKVDDFYVKMRQNVRSKLGKDPELLYYPDVPILDRVTGAGAQLFYISALTTRPGFWVGQALTSPFAVRQFLKEGTIADVIAAQGKGWGTVMTGGDAEWKTFVKDMANQSDSVHPQFMNEINNLPGMSKLTNMQLDTLVQVVTGQKPASIADAFSRYTVAAMAFHHYKQLGMSGEKLAANVRNAVDNTMVMYDREHSPSIFNKMGLVGQNIAPLQKYGIAQLENLIGDLKFIAQKPEGMSTIRAMAPAISTLLTTMIMGGAVGLPLLMEYELIRAGFVGVSKFFGWDDVEDYVPKSVIELMLTDDTIRDTLVEAGISEESAQKVEDVATHGVLSAATGYDIGSSVRFNPYVPGADERSQMSALSAFPVVKFIADFGSIVGTKLRKHTAGDVTEAEDRAASLKIQPFVGARALTDAAMFGAGEREFVPGGTRGYAQVEQTPQEQIGQLLGSKPLSTAKQNAAIQIEQKNDKKLAAMKQKAVDLLVDSMEHDDERKAEKAYGLAVRAGMTPEQLRRQVKAAMHERRTPRWQDRFTNQKGQVKSTQQKQRYERAERYE